MNRKTITLLAILIALALTACTPVPTMDIGVAPDQIQFNSERAFALETEFATTFINRHSATAENRAATDWIKAQFETRGWTCRFDDWEVIQYSKHETLRNVVCTLQGQDPRQILVVAHHDQAPTTIQGADNDASGIAIMLELAEVFAAEGPPPYSLVFVATDAEEYGMLGTRRYAQTHPDPGNIIAGMSLDNLGHPYYAGMNMELIGQGEGFGPIWLAITARETARAAGATWEVNLNAPLDQVTGQLAPVSVMDQGPLVGAGIPALGLTGEVPNTARSLPDNECLERQDIDNYPDLNYELWHAPEDTMDCQSPLALAQAGRIAEGLVRQLFSMDTFPQESGPYLYLENSKQVLRGLPLMLIFIAFTGVFFLASFMVGRWPLRETVSDWLKALPHFLSLWLPLVASVLLLYVFTKIGVLLDFELYPATTKDPYLLYPDWVAISLFLIGMAAFFILSRWLLHRIVGRLHPQLPPGKKSFHARDRPGWDLYPPQQSIFG